MLRYALAHKSVEKQIAMVTTTLNRFVGQTLLSGFSKINNFFQERRQLYIFSEFHLAKKAAVL